ncbi:ABC transporter permease [Isoptericola halotolerans]|uniref:Transport permease protein n=1 Tax=Isoptericola halotolerans TaxID=300560 RepID=A0ABX2A6C4_9MICO|nr:ABC transporter permease [Isoptericola halotolerans]NOV97445.1 lipopolysaccharide transport system permease protein [Isoptericola halotolerans]
MATVVITPPGRLGLPRWRELWAAREVMYRFGLRDVLLRYRQTAVGVAWVVIQPLLGAGIFALVFGAVAGLPTNGVPYFLFSFMGMLAWNLFSQTIARSSASLVANQALVAKVFFPRLLVPLSSSLGVLLDYAVALALGALLLVVYGVNPGWAVLLLPVWTLLLLLFALGIGIAASAVQVKYRDVGYVMPWLLQMGLYATPVAYSVEATQDLPPAAQWLFQANPLTWFLEAYRWSLLGQQVPPTWQIVGMVVSSLLVLLGGILVFQRYERQFADVI